MAKIRLSLWILALSWTASAANAGDHGEAVEESHHKSGAAPVTVEQRIRSHETAVVELCVDYLDWQFEYFSGGHAGNGKQAFAQRIRSTPGKEDGLFWPEGGRSGESPTGPLFARAAFHEEQPEGGPVPYFGYFFKTLLIRDPAVAGGGFALAAWPAAYSVTGRRTFVVSHAGEVYSKDLGPDTSRAVVRIVVFNPDRSWSRLPRRADAE
jgi:hypothetical protein